MEKCKEQTYIMVKPDGVARGLVGEIISRFEKKGFCLVALKMMKPDKSVFEQHYSEHVSKPFFPDMLKDISSGPVVGMIFQGLDVVRAARKIIGETKPLESNPGTIRGDYGIMVGKNLVHGSDSIESAKREINIWFKPEDIVECYRADLAYLYE